MQKPLISVIVPVYNVENYIDRCIQSILSQDFVDFELILVDDGSTDKSGIICDERSKADFRIRVFHIENGGAGAARKFGVRMSKGKWILFVDGDDTIPQDSILNLYNIASCQKYDIVCGAINSNNNVIFRHKINGEVNNREYIKAILLFNTSIGPTSKLYRRELFNGLKWNTPKEITNNEDFLMLLSLATITNNVFIDNDIVVYNYLFREDSISKSVKMQLHSWLLLFSFVKSLVYSKYGKEINEALYLYMLRSLYNGCIIHGVYIEPQLNIINGIKLDLNYEKLSKEDKKIFLILQSKNRQRLAYVRFQVKKNIYNFAKRCRVCFVKGH